MNCLGEQLCTSSILDYKLKVAWAGLKKKEPSDCPFYSDKTFPTQKEKDDAVRAKADQRYKNNVDPDCPDGCICEYNDEDTKVISFSRRAVKGEDIVKSEGNCLYTFETYGDIDVTHTIKHGRCYNGEKKTAVIDDNQDILVASADDPFIVSSKSLIELYKASFKSQEKLLSES